MKSVKRRVVRRLVLLCVSAVLIGGVAFVAVLASRPVHGRVAKLGLKVPQAAHKTTPVLPANSLSSPLIRLDLPVGYRAQESRTPAPGYLYQQTITKPSSFGSIMIVIAIKLPPEGGVVADPNYEMRMRQPDRYEAREQHVSGDVLTIFNDKQEAAVAAFWPHGTHEATIAVESGFANPSNDDSDEVQAVLKTVLAVWHWR